VALLDGPQLLGERVLDPSLRSAQTLAPAIDDLLRSQQVRPQQIRLVATTIGPGSFTGLRVGVTTAKTFAYAIGGEVLAVSTLETIAHQLPRDLIGDPRREIHAVLDAQRRELFVGRFRGEAGFAGDELPTLTRLDADYIVSADRWIASLESETVTGKGLDPLSDRLPATATVVPRTHWEPRAATVGRLAWRQYQAGRRDDLWKLAPLYLRPSYAEEKFPIAGTKPGPGV
jgi:tRNA threonylcarbamoyladenosine biosynthesis protein TsaB